MWSGRRREDKRRDRIGGTNKDSGRPICARRWPKMLVVWWAGQTSQKRERERRFQGSRMWVRSHLLGNPEPGQQGRRDSPTAHGSPCTAAAPRPACPSTIAIPPLAHHYNRTMKTVTRPLAKLPAALTACATQVRVFVVPASEEIKL